MKKALFTSISIMIFGLKLPFVVWKKSKIKISEYKFKSHEDMLDDEYIVTSWLDWAIDSIILLTYPIGVMLIVSILIASQKVLVIFGLVPIYFLPIFISFIRELGGSLMLLHMNVRGIEKNTHKEDI